MKWPWGKRAPDPVGDLPEADAAAAHNALAKAHEVKAATEAQWPTVHWLSTNLQRHREENHFAELFTRAMQRREP